MKFTPEEIDRLSRRFAIDKAVKSGAMPHEVVIYATEIYAFIKGAK